MKTSILSWSVMALCTLCLCTCSESDPEPMPDSKPTAENIVGTWLLASSNAENWVAYEFTETARVNAEIVRGEYHGTGTGFYSIEGDKLSGSYTTDRKQTEYLDWTISEMQPYEVDLQIYDNTTYLGTDALYRILSTVDVNKGSSTLPDYSAICACGGVTRFSVLDKEIADIDSETGEITGKKEGITFVLFNTPNGSAAVKVSVANEQSFAELLVGTWVYDVPAEKVWERYTFLDNGYVSLQWATYDGVYNLNESKQTYYTVNGETVSLSVTVDAGQINMRMETESINQFNWTYSAYDGSHFNGKYTAQRLLESKSLSPKETAMPDYSSLVQGRKIQGYESHNPKVASVDPATGQITAVAIGRTYIDVRTPDGTGVIEVTVSGGVIPVAFEDCLGMPISKVHEVIGDNAYYEDESVVLYKDYSSDITLVGVSLDEWSGLVKGIIVTYKSSVDTSQVMSILDATYVPYLKGTTSTTKAYMDTANRADAKVGVTWDIEGLTLTYVNLVSDLFPDYSLLIGKDKDATIKKMGRNPDVTDEETQNWFFSDNKGVKIVTACYTDFVNMFDKVHSVVTMLDDTMSSEDVTAFLKKKYPYYPEHSTAEDLVFIPADQSMVIYYTPSSKTIVYISAKSTSKVYAKMVAKKLRNRVKTIK